MKFRSFEKFIFLLGNRTVRNVRMLIVLGTLDTDLVFDKKYCFTVVVPMEMMEQLEKLWANYWKRYRFTKAERKNRADIIARIRYALIHIARENGINAQRWNLRCDMYINPNLPEPLKAGIYMRNLHRIVFPKNAVK